MTILALVIVKIYASKERGHFPPPLSSRTKFPKSKVKNFFWFLCYLLSDMTKI